MRIVPPALLAIPQQDGVLQRPGDEGREGQEFHED